MGASRVVVSESNGHKWTKSSYGWYSCLVCGIVRRYDDMNKPCKGPTTLRPPEAFFPKEPR